MTTLYTDNAEGRREVTALDYAGLDRITKTVRDVYSRSGAIVRRTTTQVWATDNTNTATTVSTTEQDGRTPFDPGPSAGREPKG